MKFFKNLPLLAILLLVSSCLFQSPQRRAQRKMKKEKYEKAEALLVKSIEKDSLNPAAHYLLSRLFLDTAHRQDIDTAQHFIQQALAELPEADKKDLRRLRKIEADSASLTRQLAKVDSAAFRRATEAHSLEAYGYFLREFPEAPQRAEATRLRNALAFRLAEEENSYQAYQRFFILYPEAVEAPEARERYEELLFIANTKTGTLEAYIRFLKEYPDTPYRSRLLKNIYLLGTAGHQAKQYARFIKNYPLNSYTRDAVNQLYQLHKAQNGPAGFLEVYPQLPFRDSLEQVVKLDQQLIVAVLEEQNWQFINEWGETVLPADFQDVHPDYLCETVGTDYIEAIRGTQPVVLARNGFLILDEDYEMLDDLGYGLLRIQQQGLKGLYLKSGKQLLPAAYEKIERLGENLLQVREEGKPGILTYNGQWLVEPLYDSLARMENFILLFKDQQMAVSTTGSLIEALRNNESPKLDFRYQQAQLADTAHLIVQDGQGQEAVLNNKLQLVIPPTAGKIRKFEGGWLLEENQRFKLLGKEGQDLLSTRFRDIRIKEPWIAYKTDTLWGLYHIDRQVATFDVYDSLTLLHPQIMVVHKDQYTNALFIHQDTSSLDLKGTDDYRLLRPVIRNSREGIEQAYLLVKDGNARKIYNTSGRLIEQGRYKEVLAPDERLLVLKTTNAAGIADSAGNTLLKPVYDAVGNYQDGYFATLEKSRFGIFNPYRDIHIRPQYQAALRPYSDSLLMARKNKDWGIIDLQNKRVLNFDYQELQYWSDSVALAKKEGEWFLLNLKSGETTYGPFRDFDILKQSPEESMAIIYSADGYGVLSSSKGELIAPTYDDVVNLGTPENPLFYCEKKVKEADLYVVVYTNAAGESVFKKAYPRQEWLRLLCD